ncbi:GNAT family N-acetyltransferase [Terricaulis silvestris]|uniref:Phosphatidylglycerol lysyltransferase n=1 Tax=Terricaulis silvestris TaxID=2686094 RepID=A0A6I6MSB9_9CAUL|nr:GNAT family N-acetyltransferase [Terricaulis silvestris]QGZ96326.1 Phosphatidylglycerol lysyltransferase [Terricaulis silvestris]
MTQATRGPAEEARGEPEWRARLFESAPLLFAALAFGAGAFTLIAVATPALQHVRGLGTLERLVEELPELSASVAGVVLMGLATGLRRRVDAAWAATTALMAVVCIYAALRHGHVLAASASGVVTLLLLLSRRAFYRHSRLMDLLPDSRVALGIAVMFSLALMGALLWAGDRAEFASAPWWALLTDGRLGRPGRALAAGAAIALVIAAQWYLLSRARGKLAPAASEEFARAEAMIATAEQAPPDAQLAFTGDKSFVFADGAFVMSARGGSSLIAMGPPVGKREAWRAALIALRAKAEDMSLRPVVYAAPPDLLPELIELGFRVEKIGENAVVELASFTLTGSAMSKLRSARRRFVEREGAVFELERPPHEPHVFDQLRPVSDVWLAAHGGREKAFSLGAFDPPYLSRCAIATVRMGGRVIAFANIWVTADGKRGALDLMRFDPEAAPNGLMDFLFVEILLWAQAHGLATFDLGMAPLAGLAEEKKYASLFARVGRLVHERGEQFYGFQGLRAFKDKFHPRWEPRYIAAPGAWTLPIVLAEVAVLTNGPRAE